MIIKNNSISVNQVSHLPNANVGTYSAHGINIESNPSLSIKNISICDNNIEFEREDTTPGYTSFESSGICFYIIDPNIIIENIKINNNYIVNGPVQGVSIFASTKNIEICGNTLIDAASTPIIPATNFYEYPIFFYPNYLYGYAFINNNKVIDTFDVTRIRRAYYIACNHTSSAYVSLRDNEVVLEGSNISAYGYPYIIANSNITPFIQAVHNGFQPLLSPLSYNCLSGSNILDSSNGTKWTWPITGKNWIPSNLVLTSSNAMPTYGDHAFVTYSKGTYILNTDPNTASALGWACKTSGTYSAATDATGDTDGSTATITGMTDTSDFLIGQYATVSAGFVTTGPYRILIITATTMTLDTNSDSAQSNITVSTPDPIFNALPNLP